MPSQLSSDSPAIRTSALASYQELGEDHIYGSEPEKFKDNFHFAQKRAASMHKVGNLSLHLPNLPTTETQDRWRDIFEIDMLVASSNLLKLLRAVDTFPDGLYEGPALQEAVRRYEKLWMPMIVEYEKKKKALEERLALEKEKPNTVAESLWLWERLGANVNTSASPIRSHTKYDPLVPPLDIAWVWYLHRLDPQQYVADCMMNYATPVYSGGDGHGGGFLSSSLSFSDGKDRVSNFTQMVWAALYPEEKYYPPRSKVCKTMGCGSEATHGLLIACEEHKLKSMEILERSSLVVEGEGPQKLCDKPDCGLEALYGFATFCTTHNQKDMVQRVAKKDEITLEYDFEAAAKVQREFFQEIMQKWHFYGNPLWLGEALPRYHYWICLLAVLTKEDPEKARAVVAPYDIALLWHSHMACNWAYEKHCKKIGVEKLLWHNPWKSDERDQAKAHVAIHKTKEAWASLAMNANKEVDGINEIFDDKGPDQGPPSLTRMFVGFTYKRSPPFNVVMDDCINVLGCGLSQRRQRRLWGPQPRAGYERIFQDWWIEGEYASSPFFDCRIFSLRILLLLLLFTTAVLGSHYASSQHPNKRDWKYVYAIIFWPCMAVGVFCFRPFFTCFFMSCWGERRFHTALVTGDLPHSSRSPFWDFPKKNALPFWLAPDYKYYGFQEKTRKTRLWKVVFALLVIGALLSFLLSFFLYSVRHDFEHAAETVVKHVVQWANIFAEKVASIHVHKVH